LMANQGAQPHQPGRAISRFKRNKIGIGIHSRYRSDSRLRGNEAYVLLCPLWVLGSDVVQLIWSQPYNRGRDRALSNKSISETSLRGGRSLRAGYWHSEAGVEANQYRFFSVPSN